MKLVALYLLCLVAYFAFAAASMSNPNLAIYERKINPSTFVFWEKGEFYSNPPLFSATMVDARGQFSSREPTRLEDVDILVLLLEGYEELENVEFATEFGIDAKKIATFDPNRPVEIQTVNLKFQLRPIPLFNERKLVLLVDARFLRENFKRDCLDEMIYGAMISQLDEELWSDCEIS